jgi:zinc transport system substrate-binding protein
MTRFLPLIASALCCLFATPPYAGSADGAAISVVTTILPYREFIDAVGGKRVETFVLIPPGANPHAFELTPSILTRAAAADLYVKAGSGIEFELVWADKIIAQRKGIAVCDSSRGIDLIGGDPHVWLSARNARAIVDNIRDCLTALAPEHAEEFRANAESYRERLDGLDREISARFPPGGQRAFLILHPSWGYFARDYGLEQIAVEEEGKEPSPRRLAALIDTARQKGLRRVFVSPQVSDKAARTLADEIGGEVAVANDLAGDYIENLRSFARSIGE